MISIQATINKGKKFINDLSIGLELFFFFKFIRKKERVNSCIYPKEEMGSSYTWCNSTKITHFLNRRFLRNLMVRKSL